MNAHLEHDQVNMSKVKNKNNRGGLPMKHLSITIIAAVIIMGIAAAPVYAHNSGVYIVQPGDTLLKIAARHAIRVSQLAEANGLRWNSWVYVGQRLVIPSSEPAPVPAPESVEGWEGTIVNLTPGSQHTHYFERVDGQGFGIGGLDDLTSQQIEELRWTGEQIRVWGMLRTDVPSYGGRYIAVEYLEVVSEPVAQTRNLTPLATVSASSHLPTDRWGQYQPWMATDGALGTAWAEGVVGSGVGEWIELRFPGTIEVHSIGIDVGYDKNADVFYKNNRIKRVTLIFSSGEQVDLGFADKQGMQMVPLARAPGPSIETTFVKVIIAEVFPGWKYDDTCLAEIEVWGITIGP